MYGGLTCVAQDFLHYFDTWGEDTLSPSSLYHFSISPPRRNLVPSGWERNRPWPRIKLKPRPSIGARRPTCQWLSHHAPNVNIRWFKKCRARLDALFWHTKTGWPSSQHYFSINKKQSSYAPNVKMMKSRISIKKYKTRMVEVKNWKKEFPSKENVLFKLNAILQTLKEFLSIECSLKRLST